MGSVLIIAPYSRRGSWMPNLRKLKLEMLRILLVKFNPNKVRISSREVGRM